MSCLLNVPKTVDSTTQMECQVSKNVYDVDSLIQLSNYDKTVEVVIQYCYESSDVFGFWAVRYVYP